MRRNKQIYEVYKTVTVHTEAEVAAVPPTIFGCILIGLFIGVLVLFTYESPNAKANNNKVYVYNKVYLNCPVNIQTTKFAPTGNKMLAVKQTKIPMEHSSNILNEANFLLLQIALC